jgi:hypothetical protein
MPIAEIAKEKQASYTKTLKKRFDGEKVGKQGVGSHWYQPYLLPIGQTEHK